MGAHLTREQIERYISRHAGVDEILAVSEHLDSCFECRDRAAALVDDGMSDLPRGKRRSGAHRHSGHHRISGSLPLTGGAPFWRTLLPGILIAAIFAALVYYFFLR